jgi:predicted nucleic acid-binding protein
VTLYLDTSSLVKLYVAEPCSDAVRGLVAQANVVATSGIAYPEARAALARRRRERALTVGAFTRAKRAFEDDWTKFLAVEVSASVCREAGELAERYRLRGYDAVHLASYLEIARGAGVAETQFSSFDDRLNRAAQTAGRAMARASSREARGRRRSSRMATSASSRTSGA